MDRIRYFVGSGPATGIDRTLRGLRTGDTRVLLTGAALILYRLYRRQRRTRRLLYAKRLRHTDRLEIRTRLVDQSS